MAGEVSGRLAKGLVNVCRKRTTDWARLREWDWREFAVSPITGGLSNKLYLCEAPAAAVSAGLVEPRSAKLVVREFGVGELQDPAVERKIFLSCSHAGIGPQLKAYSKDGTTRVEEFVEGAPLHCLDLHKPDIAPLMADKLALVHALDVDIPKHNVWVESTLNSWLKLATSALGDLESGNFAVADIPADSDAKKAAHDDAESGSDEDFASEAVAVSVSPARVAGTTTAMHELVATLDLATEVEWYLTTFRLLNRTPVAFCHNDVQEGNWMKTPDGSLVLIDFEYGGYNPIAYEFGNLFCEYVYDYQSTADEFPGYYCHDRYPSKEQRTEFAQMYLDAAAELARRRKTDDRRSTIRDTSSATPTTRRKRHHRITKISAATYSPPTVGSSVDLGITAEQLAEDAMLGSLGVHLVWTLWSIIQARTSLIDGFGYMEYGRDRAQAYNDLKQQVCLERDIDPILTW